MSSCSASNRRFVFNLSFLTNYSYLSGVSPEEGSGGGLDARVVLSIVGACSGGVSMSSGGTLEIT